MRNILLCAALIAAAMFGPFVWAWYSDNKKPLPVAGIPSGDSPPERAISPDGSQDHSSDGSSNATLDDVEPPAKNPLIDGLRRMLDESPAFEEHGDELRDQLDEADTLLAKIKEENRAALDKLRKGATARRGGRNRGKPNLIVIDLGRLSIDSLHCYHEEAPSTRVFDHLADQGVRFDRYYRSSLDPAIERKRFLFAGVDIADVSKESAAALPAKLAPAGYVSAIIGNSSFTELDPHDAGFDSWFGARTDVLSQSAWPASVWADGAELKLLVEGQERFDAQTIYMTEAFSFAKRHQHAQPFFVWLSLPFPDRAFPSSNTSGIRDVVPYDSQLSRVQQQLLEWIRELNDRRIANNSVVVLTSFTPPRLKADEDPLSQRRIQAPLMILAPGRIKKNLSKTLCTSADLAATLAEFAGRHSSNPQANSLLTELTEEQHGPSNREAVVWHSGEREIVVFDQWRYERAGGQTVGLFDLDSAERLSKNVAGLHPQVVVRAKHLLQQASP